MSLQSRTMTAPGAPGARRRAAACIALVLGLLLTLSVWSAGRDAWAQGTAGDAAPAAAAEEIEPRETIFTLIMKGGWIMVPIGLCSILVVTVSIERAISLRRSRVETPDLLDRVIEVVPDRASFSETNREAALELCSRTAVIDRVLQAGIEKLHRDEGPVVEVLEEAAARETHKLSRRIRPLAMVAALSPLLGLLGTIYGMITCFENAVAADTASRAATLASGIYVALVSTAAGMTVAIPAMLLNFYFQGRIDRVTDRLDESATALVEHYFGVPAPSDGTDTLSVKRSRAEHLKDRAAKAGS